MVLETPRTPPLPTPPTEIFYPDCDGEPVANNTEQFELIMLIKGNLDILFGGDSNVFIAGDLFWYPIEGNNTVKYAPDVMVALGRPKGKRYSYKQWEEDNQPPQVIFEILSPSNTAKEMQRKLLFYDRHGVEEYYVYDPALPELSVWLRGEMGLDLAEVEQIWTSPQLGIRFEMGEAGLALFYPDGRPFLSFMELQQRAETAERQVDQLQVALQQAIAQLVQMGLSTEQVAERLKLPLETVQLHSEKQL
jgi:Uma2 family endonuclease